MIPQKKGVWEIRLADVRLYGVFHRPDCFIVAAGALASETHGKGSKAGSKRDAVVAFVSSLPLAQPKIDHRRNFHDLVSNPTS